MLSGLIRTWLFALKVQTLDFVNKQDGIWSVSRFTLPKFTAPGAHSQHARPLFTVRKEPEHLHWPGPSHMQVGKLNYNQKTASPVRNQNKGS